MFLLKQKKSKMMLRYIIIIIIATLTSCTQYKANKYNDISTPKAWHTKVSSPTTKNSNQNYNQLWWQNFNDQKLKKVVQYAIDNNLDYKIALARVEHAKAMVSSSKSVLFPDISLQENVTASKNSSSINKVVRTDSATLNASWEIDLFGQNRHVVRSSNALLKSQINKANYLLISIVAETINTYLEYKATAKSLYVAKKVLDIEKLKLKLIKEKEAQGINSEIDINNQSSLVLSNQVQIQNLSTRLQQLEYKIEILCGKTPGSMANILQGTNLPSFNQKILLHSPIKVIRQRPDIIAANYDLMSATSITKSTIAKQFPSINLGAAFGYQNSDLLSSHRMWSFSQGLILLLINFGRIKSEINMSRAKENEAFIKYQHIIYKALEDVESALSYYKYNLDNYNDSQKIVAAKQKNLTLTKSKYNAKTIEYNEVLEAEKSLHNAEKELANNQAMFNQSIVRLSKSLGYKVT